MLFSLDFAGNTILTCLFFCFLFADLCLLIPAVIAQFVKLIAKLAMTTGIPIKEAKEEMDSHQVTVETKLKMCSV